MRNKLAIIILGGGIKKDKNGKWRTTNFDEKGDNFGASGDRLRVIAGSYLYKDNPEKLIIASGGKGQLKDIPDAPTVASVIKKELIELDVPADKILEENNSGNTYQQLQEMKKNIQKKALKNITVISNKWHLPRIKAMIKIDPDLKKIFGAGNLKILSTEEICLTYKPKVWQPIIKAAYESEDIKKRIKLEQEGVKQIKEGTYKFK